MNFKELCKINPQFVIARYDKSGWSLDDTVEYEGPFASHELSQASGYEHPSLEVESKWDLDKSKSISGVITGKKGNQVLRGGPTTLIKFTNGKFYIVSGKNNASAASISEISKILNNYSKKPGNIPYRGSPLEYKRILDYLQFYATKKVADDSSLYFARPNNLSLMENIRFSNKIEDIYNALIADKSPKFFSKAYFVSFDKIAAFASVVRNVPTLFVKADEKNAPRTFVKIAKKGSYEENVKIIRNLIKMDLRNTNLTEGGPDIVSKGIKLKPIISYGNLPIITQGDLFGWFLNVENLYKVSGKFMSDVSLKTLILFYWIFFYPNADGSNVKPNMKIIEYFLTIADTFHDFGKQLKNFPEIWFNNKNFNNSKSKSENGISISNKPNTSNQLKFIVKLLGVDIYRAVDRYNTNVMNTLSTTNKRTINLSGRPLTPGLKVAHFLYLITNIFGHKKSGFVKETEEYGKQLMIRMGKGYIKDKNESELCSELNTEGACIVVDAIQGSLPKCMLPLSVYHNVGILDTATKTFLSWGNLSTPNGCPKTAKRKPSTARPKTAKPSLGVKSIGVTKPTTAAAQRRAEEKAAKEKAARRAATARRRAEEKATEEKAARNAANAAARQTAARSARATKRGRNNNPSTTIINLTNESPRIFSDAEYFRAAKIAWQYQMLNDISKVNNYKSQNTNMKKLIKTIHRYLTKLFYRRTKLNNNNSNSDNNNNMLSPRQFDMAVSLARKYYDSKESQNAISQNMNSRNLNLNTFRLVYTLLRAMRKLENN